MRISHLLPAAALLAACATHPGSATTPYAASAQAQPCDGHCAVLVDNPTQRELEVYYNTVRDVAPELLGIARPGITTRLTIPAANAGWVLLTVRDRPNGSTLDVRRLQMEPGRTLELRINVDRRRN